MAYEFRGNTLAKKSAAGGKRSSARRERSPRTPRPARARTFLQTAAAVMGLAFLLAGIGGFIPGITSNYDELRLFGTDSNAELLGLFRVSVLHNIVHLLFAVGLLAAARESWSRLYLLGGGASYLLVLVYGFVVDKESEANFLPLNQADNLLHLGLTLAMIGLGVAGVAAAKRAGSAGSN